MVGPVQLDRRRIGGRRAARGGDRRAARICAQDPQEVGHEVSDRAAALAARPFGFEDLDAGLGEAAEVRECELGLGARGVHRAQLVERA